MVNSGARGRNKPRMKFIKVLIILAAAYGGYQYWQQHQAEKALLAVTNANGFVELPTAPDGQNRNTVYVVAAENCPHEAAQRADRLAEALVGRNVPVERTHHVSFSTLTDMTQAQRVSAVMNSELPIVFVNGHAKSNPSIDEVISEYRSRNSP
jgi:hypothetical protein